MEDDEHAVLGFANVELVAVAAEFESGAKCFERVLVGVFGRTAMADHVGTLAALSDAFVPE